MTGVPVKFVDFFTAIRNFFPAGITWTIPSSGDQIEDDRGELVGAWAAAGGGTVTSNGGAADWMPGVGARVRWNTLGLHRGRRVVGTTFLCPMTEQEITGGVIQGTTVTAIQTAAQTLADDGTNLVIFGKRLPATPTKPEAPGGSFDIQTATVPSAMTWLRSRRV